MEAVARWRNRAFWRHVITSSGRVLETDGDVVDEAGMAEAIANGRRAGRVDGCQGCQCECRDGDVGLSTGEGGGRVIAMENGGQHNYADED